jgi:tyrosine-protein kinase Etk/Wzc
MNEQHADHIQPHLEEIDLVDYINVVSAYRRTIVRNVVVVAVLVGIITLFLPKRYVAETSLLPPDDAQSSSLLSTLAGTPLAQLGISPASSTSDLFVQILQSRSVLDQVVQTAFDDGHGKTRPLMEIMKIRSREGARKVLQQSIRVSASTEGVIRLAVEMPRPKLAADVANAFVAALDQINQEKYTTRAKNSRIYIEQQLEETEQKLKQAADSLMVFKETYKAVSLEEQTKVAIEQAGEIKGKIIAKEVELGVALQTMKANNVYIVQLKKEIEELNKQYNKMQIGDAASLINATEFYIPFSEVPEVGLKLANLTRNMKVQQTVWELLNQQYYQAKIQEARDTPTVQVLDEAIPPEKAAKPQKKLLVIVAAFLALMMSIFWAFIKTYWEKTKHEGNSPQFITDMNQDYQLVKKWIEDRTRQKNKNYN